MTKLMTLASVVHLLILVGAQDGKHKNVVPAKQQAMLSYHLLAQSITVYVPQALSTTS